MTVFEQDSDTIRVAWSCDDGLEKMRLFQKLLRI